MRIRRAFIKFPCLHGSMQPFHRVTFSPSIHASVPTRNQKIVPPSHNHTLPPGTPSNRATCHTHAATVSLWNLVRHLVRHRDTTVPPGAPPWNHRTTVSPADIRHVLNVHVLCILCIRDFSLMYVSSCILKYLCIVMYF